MKTEGFGLLQHAVQEEEHVVIRIVDQPEGRNAAGFQAKVFQHTLGRSEGQFATGRKSLGLQARLEALLQVVNAEVVVAMKANQIVLIALVVAHEDVLAVDRPVVLPPLLSLFDGFALGVVIDVEGDVVRLQKGGNGLLACHAVSNAVRRWGR